jgi:flagellar motor switch protein FliN/FliY
MGDSAEFEQLTHDKTTGTGQDLDLILDIPVTLSVEMGQTKISIRELLKINQGSVVELNKKAGESFDIKVNGMLVAHGEVVVVGTDTLGIRVTDVISTAERIEKLR